ncbi:MAG: TQO small subunit DoxD [Candidatus Levybacteria bacterium GW2011_GWB1_37_8]|nr:MAG: TQO small subunit DoxD [Candidatus Levybacteria bacterium GW2011_GWB1_37_8]
MEKISSFLFSNTKLSWLWFFVRIYVGWTWLTAGWDKVISPVWAGDKAGVAVSGFLTKSLTKTTGAHPDVQGWYAYFIETIALPNSEIFSYVVSFGEFFVGIALILGAVTGIAAFFGAFMNINYLFAGTVSTNPELLLLEIFIMLAWKTAGWYGLDRFILPQITACKSGKASKKRN